MSLVFIEVIQNPVRTILLQVVNADVTGTLYKNDEVMTNLLKFI